MPTFQYEALNEAGKPQKGVINANNNEDAVARIRSQGLFPTAVREQKAKKAKSAGAGGSAGSTATMSAPAKKKSIGFSIGGIGRKALTTFTRQFATLQEAGLPILRSLQILHQQQKPGPFKNMLDAVQEDVSGGSTLSDAMARQPKAFDRLYCKMIAAGEVAGVLDMILQRLAEFLEKAARLRRRIIGAMIYPSVVVLVAMAIMSFIMVFIVPKFQSIFDDFGTSLPTLTTGLIKVSAWLAGPLVSAQASKTQLIPGIVYVAFSPVILFLLLKLIRKSEGGKYALDALALKIPVAGMLVAKATIAKFTRTLGTLVRAGVPILDAIIITRDTTANAVFQRALTRVHESVRQGESFAEPLRQARVCDAIVTNMIAVGEETGDLDKMLLKIADNYDDEVDTAVASLVSLLEPLMVVVLGLMVGTIVLALFLPLVALITKVSEGGKS